ncbi:phage tail family protein [Staphylococcus americanisciuri]|uniref:Phage tail family protein n=1 Tax=Staphylococcus americanisciuri TaxID=2973940 RepID=A0ABT2F1Z6_9STAP|nr:phage tail family protein [Staphylococcus americanisciuri]MCS4486389.1 phage tail family protein [Staphylococcus americanisciuri]
MANETVIVNNKKLDWLFIERGFQIPSFHFVTSVESVPGRVGAVRKSRELEGYEFELPLIVRNDYLAGHKTHDQILREVVKFFDYDEPVKLQLSKKDWYWNAFFDGPIELVTNTKGIITFKIKIVLTDPYKYSVNANQNTAISDSVSVVNLGTAPTPIIVEARALKDSTNFMIAKGDKDYFMIGKSEDANKVSKDIAPYLFNDEFNNGGLRLWASMPNDTSFGRFLDGGDAMGGTFGVAEPGESIYPKTWGSNTKTDWHGPAVYKTLNKSVQDFRIRFKLSIHHQWGIGTGKAVAYLVDENNRTQFSVVYVNTSATVNNAQIVVYAYDEHGSARKVYTRDVPNYYKKLKTIQLYMFLERKGQNLKFTNYFFDVYADGRRGTPLAIGKDERVIVDRGNLYQRKVRICRMYRGKAAKYDKYLWHSILGFSIQELLPSQSDITPIEIRKGDKIVIDTLKKAVTINDDDALHLKDLASNYFEIEKGTSELIIYPPKTFDTTVKWQDRFL